MNDVIDWPGLSWHVIAGIEGAVEVDEHLERVREEMQP